MSVFLDIVLGIIFFALLIGLLAAIVFYFVDRAGFTWWWDKGKKAIAAERYPCLLSGDCGNLYGLGPSYVCDPHLKQCRLRAYEPGSCTNTNDCLQITPACHPSIITQGPSCMTSPYQAGGVYGQANAQGNCNPGLSLTTLWNFCQVNLGSPCKVTDDCHNGTCQTGHCTYLGPFGACTESSSYAIDQCEDPLYCAPPSIDRPLGDMRCMRPGIKQRDPGAYCLTNSDCSNGNCYRTSLQDPVGICAANIALIGMSCTNGGDCVQGLDCLISAPGVGICVLTDLTTVTDVKHCPAQYSYLNAGGVGCSGALNPVPCSNNVTCAGAGGCPIGDISRVVMGVLQADNTWLQIYPSQGHQDNYGIFSSIMSAPGGQVTLKPNYTVLISPLMAVNPVANIYPTIVLNSSVGPPPVVEEARACTPLIGGNGIYSSFANAAESNITFIVNYEWSNPSAASVQVLITSPLINQGDPLLIVMPSSQLITYYATDKQDPTASTQAYIYNNYIGPTDSRFWNMSVGDLSDFPTAWQFGGSTAKTPPIILQLPTYSSQSPVEGKYIQNSLRLDQQSAWPEIFAHFFYYPSNGTDKAGTTSKFMTLPTQGGGGVTTLVGLFDIDSLAPDPDGRPLTRRIVISTLAVYISSIEEEQVTTAFSSGRTVYAQRKLWYSDLATGLGIYTSCYSFTLVDFNNNWPFTLTLTGPTSTQNDTAGLCGVAFSSATQGVATETTLAQDANLGIPGLQGKYPVFTPRAYTRVQVQTTTRTAQWTTTMLFNVERPQLVDSDLVVMASAGAHSIIGILLTLNCGPAINPDEPQPYQTLLITMRFGDTLPSSLYSLNNLNPDARVFANRTKMFTFYLTADLEETGGGSGYILLGNYDYMLAQFPIPQVALAPQTSQDISNWATPEITIVSDGTPYVVDNSDASLVSHGMRTPWGIEVFTASLIPELLSPPVRFFRMPVAPPAQTSMPYALSEQGGDDIWVWGRYNGDQPEDDLVMVCVPLFFDNLGTVETTAVGGWVPGTNPSWLSTTATTCPPQQMSILFTDMDNTYTYQDPYGHTGSPYQQAQWNVTPSANIVDRLAKNADGTPVVPPFVADPLPLIGRMCETQGYQDGILYRARPYSFAAPLQNRVIPDPSLPPNIRSNLTSFSYSSSEVEQYQDLQSMAVAMASIRPDGMSPPADYRVAIPVLGLGGITAMIGPNSELGSVHPRITGFFPPDSTVWVSSESGTTPILPGGYRTLPCPLNPRAVPINQAAQYPAQCKDAVLTPVERKPLPIVMGVQTASGFALHLYDIRMNRDPKTNSYSVQVLSDKIIDTNGGLAVMGTGYPGFSGGPVLIYTPCQ